MKKLCLTVMVIVLMIGLIFTGCAKPAPTTPTSTAPTPVPTKKVLTIMTSPTGGSYQLASVGISSVLSKYTGITVVNKPVSGAREYLPLLNGGTEDFCYVNANEALWGVRGNAKISTTPLKNLRIVFDMKFQEFAGLFSVRQDSGITKISQLKGKRVSGNYASNPSAAAVCEAFLMSVGMTWKDVVMVPANAMTDGTADLREGRVDATSAGGPYVAFTQELHTATPIRPLNFADTTPDKINTIPKELIEKIRREATPALMVYVSPPAPPVAPEPLTMTGWGQFFLASASLSEQIVYEVTKTLFTHYEELWPIHAWLKNWNPKETFTPDAELPFHPGAIRYLKEIGIWTAQAEQQQQALLAKLK